VKVSKAKYEAKSEAYFQFRVFNDNKCRIYKKANIMKGKKHMMQSGESFESNSSLNSWGLEMQSDRDTLEGTTK